MKAADAETLPSGLRATGMRIAYVRQNSYFISLSLS